MAWNIELIIVKALYFFKVFSWSLLGIGAVGLTVFFMLFRFQVEVNMKTGSGYGVKTLFARKSRGKDGNFWLVTLRGRRFLFPTDYSFCYRKKFFWMIRYYQISDDGYSPMKMFGKAAIEKHREKSKTAYKPIVMNIGQASEIFLEPVPQNLKFLFKAEQESIEKKYQAKQSLLAKFAPLAGIGLAVLLVGFVVYLTMDRIDSLISLGHEVSLALKTGVQQNIPVAPP